MPGGSPVGSVSVSIVPSAQGLTAKLREQILPEADRVGLEAGERIREGIDERLHDISIGAHVEDELAKAEIDELRAKVDELSHKKASIDVSVNNASGVRSWLVSLVAGAVAIAPAFAVAAVGVGAFAAIAVPSIAKVVQYEQQIGKNAATAAKDWAGLTQQQRAMAAGLSGLKAEFGALSHELQPEVLTVFNAALGQAGAVLREIAPLAVAGGEALRTLINDIGGAFTGSAGAQFFQFVAHNLQPDVEQIGQTVAALIRTFFSLVEAMQPVSLGLLSVVRVTADLLSWLSRVAPPLDDVVVLAIALYKPLQVIKGLEIAATFANMATALKGMAVAADAQGLKFNWVVNAVSGFRDLAAASVLAAAGQEVLAVASTAEGAAFLGEATAAEAVTIAISEMTAAETAAAVASGVLDAVNPLAWVGLAIAAVAGLVYGISRLGHETNAVTQGFIAQHAASGWTVRDYTSAAAALGKYASAQHEVTTAGVNLHTGLQQTRTTMGGLSSSTVQMTQAQQKQLTEGRNLQHFYSDLSSRYGLTAKEAQSLAGQLGITADQVRKGGQSAQDAEQQIGAFYQTMLQASQGTGALTSNLKVLAFAADQQASATSKLASAWDTYVSSLTGTQSTFDSFALSMSQLSKDAKATGASFGGLSKTSLTLNQDFQSQVGSLQAVSTSLRTSGVSAKTFDEGIRGGIASLIRFAGGSKIAQQELLAVARQADGGITSFRGLTQWAGNTATGTKRMQDAMDKATLSEARMSDASKRLANSLQNDVSQMMAQAALKTSGAQQAMDHYVSALQNSQTPLSTVRGLHQQLIAALEKSGETHKQAEQDVDALTRRIRGEGTAAGSAAGSVDKLALSASTLSSNTQQAIDQVRNLENYIANLHGKTINIVVNASTRGHLPAAFNFATGGVVPGRDTGRDYVPVLARGGEGMLVPEAVTGLGGASVIDAINRRFGGGGVNPPGHYAGGGVIAASSSFQFPQDVFDINVYGPWGPWGFGGGGGSGSGSFSDYHQLHGELRKGADVGNLNQAGKELGKAFHDAYRQTADQIKAETKTALSDIREYYSGPAATRLRETIRTQTGALEKLAEKTQGVANEIASMKQYAAQETQNLQSFSDLSTISGGTDANGNTIAPTGKQIVTSLQHDLATLRKFFKIIGELKAAGLNKIFIAQVVALGPEDGVTYGEAVLAGGKSLIREINKDEKEIQQIDIKIGHRAADIQFGQPLAKSFLSQLEKEKSKLESQMKHLGDTIARELERALHHIKVKVSASGAASVSASAVSNDALGSAVTVGGTTATHALTRSDVTQIRQSLRAIETRELNLMTRAQATRIISLLEVAPVKTGNATGRAVASELNAVAKSAAATARARTR